MAYFENVIIPNYYGTIQFNGTPLTNRTILNFTGTAISVTDNAINLRTDFTSTALPTTGGTMTGNLILNADPTTGLQAATKQYVDSIGAGLSPKASCIAATTGSNLNATYNNGASGVGATLTNAGTQAAFALDGVSLSSNQRVLIKDQTSQAQNGIYTVTTVGDASHNWVLTRATDFNSPSTVSAGSYTIITMGTVNASQLFIETGTGPFTIGTTPITFSNFNSSANLSFTAPLTAVGNVVSLTTPLAANYGGTGVANASGSTITLGGAMTLSGAFAFTGTLTNTTSVTFPTSGTLVNSAVATLSSLSSIGTITTGTWNGSLITGTYGGTGVNNGSSTITLGGSLTTSGAFASTFTMTNTTSVTFPTSGTLATTSQLPTLPLSLANGGTNANLTASNGGIFYSTASAGAILAGTTTASQILLSGASAAPTWSTSTYPTTNAINTLLYASSANVMAALATANNGVLVTSSGGVPSISSTIPNATQLNITATGALAAGSLTTGFTAVAVPQGGTGLTSCSQGDLFYGSASNTISNLVKNTTATRYLANTGTSNNPNWDQVNLSNGVTNTLGTANGGTGVTASNPVIQRVSTETGAVATGTTLIPLDDTIPQNTEGDQYMTLSITPKNSSNILVIDVVGFFSYNGLSGFHMALFQDSTANALAVGTETCGGSTYMVNIVFRHIMTAGTTSSTTFKIRAGGNNSGTTTFNGTNSGRLFGGVLASSITITEYST